MITCPNKKCNKELDHVNVYSECYQKGLLSDSKPGNEIKDYGSVEEVLETVGIECPHCGEDVRSLVVE